MQSPALPRRMVYPWLHSPMVALAVAILLTITILTIWGFAAHARCLRIEKWRMSQDCNNVLFVMSFHMFAPLFGLCLSGILGALVFSVCGTLVLHALAPFYPGARACIDWIGA